MSGTDTKSYASTGVEQPSQAVCAHGPSARPQCTVPLSGGAHRCVVVPQLCMPYLHAHLPRSGCAAAV